MNFPNRNDDFLKKRGVKLKLEPRYYLSVSRKGHVLWYAAGEVYFNRIRFDRKATRRECFDRDCQFQYERQFFFRGAYRESGVGLKGGLMIGRNRLLLDINSGFALRMIDYTVPEVTPGWPGDETQAWYDIPNESDRTAIGPLLGIRLGYRLY